MDRKVPRYAVSHDLVSKRFRPTATSDAHGCVSDMSFIMYGSYAAWLCHDNGDRGMVLAWSIAKEVIMRRLIATAMLVAALGTAGCYENVERLEDTAKTYVQRLGYTPVGASCMNRDSDNDGYVSCTVTVKNMVAPMAVECASRWRLLTQGCKLQRSARIAKLVRTGALLLAEGATR
jgi:hypothetical protein